MNPAPAPDNRGDLVPFIERRNFAAQMGPHFPSLTPSAYRVIGPADIAYDCLGVVTLLCQFDLDPKTRLLSREQLEYGVAERNRISSLVSLDRALKAQDFTQYCKLGQDQHFAQLGLARQAELDLSHVPGTTAVVMYLTDRPDLRNFHVAIQDRDGAGWISKMGAYGPLILHTEAASLLSSVFERTVAVYRGPAPTRTWGA